MCSEPRHSRHHLQVRICCVAPRLHEHKVDVWGTNARPSPEVVRIQRCLWLDLHVLRRTFDVHCGDGVEGAGNYRISSYVGPQSVCIPHEVDLEQHPEKSMESRMWLMGKVAGAINDIKPAREM